MSTENNQGWRPKFDPQTGRPLDPGAEQPSYTPKFDPQTGKPLNPAPAQQSFTPKFDPQTGRPVAQPQEQPAYTPKFDPDTGRPIQPQNVNPQPVNQQPVNPQPQQGQSWGSAPSYGNTGNAQPWQNANYDPRGGQTGYSDTGYGSAPSYSDTGYGSASSYSDTGYGSAPSYQNTPGQGPSYGSGQRDGGSINGRTVPGPGGFGPDGGGKGGGGKSKKPMFLALAVIAVVAVVAIVLLKVVGIGGGPLQQIQKAAKNTFSMDDPLLAKVGELNDLTKDGTFGMDVRVVAKSAGFGADVAFDVDKKGQSLAVDVVTTDGTEINAVEYMDANEVIVGADGILDDPLSYPYAKSGKEGWLIDMMEQQGGSTIVDTIDETLKMGYGLMTGAEEKSKEVQKIAQKYVKELKFEKVSDTISWGKGDKKVSGYETTITREWLQDYMDEVYDVMYGDSLETLMTLAGSAAGTSMPDPEEMLKDMPDLDVQFFIEKNKLIGISVEPEDEEKVVVTFEGDDVPWYNTIVYNDGDAMGALKVTRKGDKETITVGSEGSDPEYTVIYNTKSGELSVQDHWEDEIFSGELYSDKGGLHFDTVVEGVTVEAGIRGSSSLQKPAGTAQDVTEMSESDFMALASNLSQNEIVQNLMYMF